MIKTAVHIEHSSNIQLPVFQYSTSLLFIQTFYKSVVNKIILFVWLSNSRHRRDQVDYYALFFFTSVLTFSPTTFFYLMQYLILWK